MEFFLVYAAPFLILVNLVALVHSGGHFIAARWFGIGIEAVSFGLGPSVVKFLKAETSWKVGCLPIGGHIRAELRANEDGVFRKVIAVQIAGPVASILFAAIVVYFVFSLSGIPIVHGQQVALSQQSTTDTLLATARLIFLSWTNWSIDSWGGFASLHDSAMARIAFLTAVASSKIGILNLLPIPKFDGWKIVNLILEKAFGPKKSGSIIRWLLRAEVAAIVLVISYMLWTDFVRLSGGLR